MLFTVKLFPQTIWGKRYQGDFNALIADLQKCGIANITVPVFQGSRLFYPEENSEKRNGAWDLLPLREASLEAGIGFIPQFPVYHDPDTYENIPQFRPVTREKQPIGATWYKPICPSNETYRNFRVQLMNRAIKYFQPRIISLDFLQYPYLFGDTAFGTPDSLPTYCFCDFCRQLFQNYAGSANPFDDIDLWFRWRAENITLVPVMLAEEIERTGQQISILAQLPPVHCPPAVEMLRRFAGQDLQQWRNIVNIVSPHLYIHQTGLESDWALEYLQEIRQSTGLEIMPELDLPIGADASGKARLAECIESIASQNFQAISLFHWELLSENDAVRAILEAHKQG